MDRYLAEHAERRPEKPFLVGGGSRTTFAELHALSASFARYLSDAGVRRGDRVAILLENSAEYAVTFLGTLRAGAIAVPLSEQSTLRSSEAVFRNFEPSAVVARGRVIDALRGAVDALPSVRATVRADGTGGLADSAKGGSSPGRGSRYDEVRLSDITRRRPGGGDPAGPGPGDVAMIIYTSGTTGAPKGVTLTHDNIVANALSIIEYLKLSDADSAMVVLPFFYSYGNSLLTTHLIAGGTLYLENGFLYPNVVLDSMVSNGVTGFAGVPSTFAILLQRSNLRSLRFPRLRYVTQAGGAMAPRHAEELRTILPGTDIYIMYGQTEATARLTWLDPRDLVRKCGSIGKAIPGVEIALKKEDGNEAAPGEVGEIVARGANIMQGYWRNPSETEKVLRSDGLHTGDLARRDEEGFLYIVGRRSDMIKSGAHRISPKEIEEVLLEFPGIREAAVVGAPDDTLGEIIQAFIVPKGEWKPDAKEVLLHCRRCLPSFKVPKKVVLIDELPKTASGKIRRQELAESKGGQAR